MKKSYNPTDVHQKEGQEQAKKLYRYIREHVKSLDDARSCARTIPELFKPSVQVQRSKFKDYCERLIFTNPVLTGRKGEELLWRKGFYEVVVTAKQLKKNDFTPEEKSNLENHINAGIGHYHHYILRLQKEYELDLIGVADFVNVDYERTNGKVEIDKELLEWANLSVHRSLVYLGDLCRYKLDLYPNWDQNLVIRYYSQALLFKPEFGMPHNQMGTLANNSNNALEATYHYVRSLCCQNTFEGTENNLQRLFEKNLSILNQIPVENSDSDVIIQPEPSEHIKRFLSRFLNLVSTWWFEKKNNRIYDLCHQTNVDLQECMTYLKPLTTESIDTNDVDTTDTDSLNTPSYLSHNVIFKIVSICLLCVFKLQSSNSSYISSAVAFSLAVYSQLVATVINHIHEGILNFPLPPTENNLKDLKKWLNKTSKKKKIKRRRRKLISNSDSEESSEEENNEDDDNESLISNHSDSEPEEDQDVSEAENIEIDGDTSSSDDDKNLTCAQKDKVLLNGLDDKSDKSSIDGGVKNNHEDILKKSKLLDLNDLFSIIGDEPLLQCIKIFNDWLKADVEILKSCGKLTRSLLHQIINLTNLINIDFSSLTNNNNNNTNNEKFLKEIRLDFLKENEKRLVLPEDIMLKGIEILRESQSEISWQFSSKAGLNSKEQSVVRIMKMMSFGHFLTTIPETGTAYDRETKTFIVKAEEQYLNGTDEIVPRDTEIDDLDSVKKPDENKNIDIKGQLMKMKHMGQLWLTAEVKDLESRVKGKASLSPYLVIDADSLILHTSMVKQLVFSRKFIVLVPTAVVSALDDLKAKKLEARDAIRWLESQFHHGNRFFRAQRPQERSPIPYIKYPKKKDKELQMFIQIIECCHYLAQQQKGASNLVTLLVGNTSFNNTENKDISFIGLAQSAGVNLEGIADFYSRWKKTAKGKR